MARMTPGRFGLLAIVALAACGGDAARSASRTPAPTATPLPSVGSLRMVKPPVVVYDDAGGYLDLWVRLNRPIKKSDLIPDSYGDRGVFLLALKAEPRYGAAADVRFPTCYSETLEVGDVPAAGTPIDVELTLGPGQGMRAKARLQYATHDTHPARQLGCPRDPDGHVCSGTVRGKRVAIERNHLRHILCHRPRGHDQRRPLGQPGGVPVRPVRPEASNEPGLSL